MTVPGTLSELPCGVGRGPDDDGLWVWQSWVTPPSLFGQNLSLSCWAKGLSSTGELSSASMRAFQVGEGLVHCNQTVSISNRHLVIWRFSNSICFSVPMEISNCTPRKYHLWETWCSSRCRNGRSFRPAGSVIVPQNNIHMTIILNDPDPKSLPVWTIFSIMHWMRSWERQ